MERQKNKLKENKKYLIFLGIIGLAALSIRLLYFPYEFPFSLDAIEYFVYAGKLSQSGQFPTDFISTNNGWSTFLALFFSLTNSENFFDYVNIQRSLGICISIVTIIPLYFLCSKFVDKRYALIGTSLFVFEPRIIQNSFSGITDPAFIFLTILSLALFFSSKNKIVYISFAMAALAALVRYEGLLLIIPLSIIFLIKYRKEKKVILKYFLAIIIFILVLLPMAYIRIETTGQDGLISHFIGAQKFMDLYVIQGLHEDDDFVPGKEGGNRLGDFIVFASIALVKFLGWITIPMFIIFLPLGIIFYFKEKLFKKISHEQLMLILFFVIMLIPAVYAYGRGIQETRYLFVILPIFCIISSFAIKKIELQFNNRKLVPLIVVIILISSITFIEIKKIDYEFEEDSYNIAKYIVKNADGINTYSEGKFIKVAEIEQNFPKLPDLDKQTRHISLIIKIISTDGFENLEEFIKESKDSKLTHLVIDEKDDRNFLNEVFVDEKKHPYLTKEYDSADINYKYHVKIFKINYNIFFETIDE